MPSLSPEAIEILKLSHGQMWLRFKTAQEAWAFHHRIRSLEFFETEHGKFQLSDCFDWPEYMWPDDDEEAYWFIKITSYGRCATNLLKTLGMV